MHWKHVRLAWIKITTFFWLRKRHGVKCHVSVINSQSLCVCQNCWECQKPKKWNTTTTPITADKEVMADEWWQQNTTQNTLPLFFFFFFLFSSEFSFRDFHSLLLLFWSPTTTPSSLSGREAKIMDFDFRASTIYSTNHLFSLQAARLHHPGTCPLLPLIAICYASPHFQFLFLTWAFPFLCVAFELEPRFFFLFSNLRFKCSVTIVFSTLM